MKRTIESIEEKHKHEEEYKEEENLKEELERAKEEIQEKYQRNKLRSGFTDLSGALRCS